MSGPTAAKTNERKSSGQAELRTREMPLRSAPRNPNRDVLTLQRSAGNRAVNSLIRDGLPPVVQDVINSEGKPLEPSVRGQMESRFGHNFSQVRVHTGSRADDSAKEVSAKAYAVGQDVVFGPGRYSPETRRGKQLLAHELAHVVQQGRGGEAPGRTHEIDADQAAEQVATGQNPTVQASSTPGMALAEDDDLRALQRRDAQYDDRENDEDLQHSRQRLDQRARERGIKTEQKRSETEINIRADQELREMEAKAARGDYSNLSPREKLKLLNRYEQLSAQTGNFPKQLNLRKGTFWENISMSPRAPKQVIFVGGGKALYPEEIDPRRDRHTRADRVIGVKNPFGKETLGAENKKADEIHRMTPREAERRAEDYLIQAHKNAASLPDGTPIVIAFARTPGPEVRKAIVDKLFQEGSPVTEVRFGQRVIRKPPEKAGPVVIPEDLEARAIRRSQQRRRRDRGRNQPGGSRPLRKSSEKATYSATAKSYQRHPVPNPEVIKIRSKAGPPPSTASGPQQLGPTPANAPTPAAPEPPGPTRARAATAENQKSGASKTSSPENKPTSPKGSAGGLSETGDEIAVATKPETSTKKKTSAEKRTDTKKTTGTSTADRDLASRKSDLEEQLKSKAQKPPQAIKQISPVSDKPTNAPDPTHPLSTPKPTLPLVKASLPPDSSPTPPGKAAAPQGQEPAAPKAPAPGGGSATAAPVQPTPQAPAPAPAPVQTQGKSPTVAPAPAAPKLGTTPPAPPVQQQGETPTVAAPPSAPKSVAATTPTPPQPQQETPAAAPAPATPKSAAVAKPLPTLVQPHRETPIAAPVPPVTKLATAPAPNVPQRGAPLPTPAAPAPHSGPAPAKATPPKGGAPPGMKPPGGGANKALGAANTALGAIQDYQQRKARGDSTSKAILGAAITTSANLQGGPLGAVVNFSNNLDANLAAGQGKGEASASALGGVGGSAIASRVAPTGPVGMAVNVINTGLQVAGAPKQATDVTQTAADVVPANFITTTVTQGARSWQNILTGDTKAIDRQVKEMIEGKAGMPLEGYARSVDIASDLAYRAFSGDKNAKDVEQIFLRQKFSGSEKSVWYALGGDQVLRQVKFAENIAKGKGVKEAYADAEAQFHDSLQDDVEKWVTKEATQFVKKDLPEAAGFLKQDLQRAKVGASQALGGVKAAAGNAVKDAQKQATQAVRDVKQSASDAYQGAKQRASEKVEQTNQAAKEFVNDAKDKAAEAVNQTKEALERRAEETRDVAAEKMAALRSAADQKVASLKEAAKKRFTGLFD